MEKKRHSPGDFQPLLLVLLVIAVIIAAIAVIYMLGGSYLRTESGGWADVSGETAASVSGEAMAQTGESPADGSSGQTGETSADGSSGQTGETSAGGNAGQTEDPQADGAGAQTETPVSDGNTGTENPGEENAPQTETPSAEDSAVQTENPTADGSAGQSEAAAGQTESESVYMVLQVTCNFRAGPSMDAEIYGTREAGTTVQFLEDVGGWYHVIIDGVEGLPVLLRTR